MKTIKFILSRVVVFPFLFGVVLILIGGILGTYIYLKIVNGTKHTAAMRYLDYLGVSLTDVLNVFLEKYTTSTYQIKYWED